MNIADNAVKCWRDQADHTGERRPEEGSPIVPWHIAAMPAHAGVTLTLSQSGNDVVADSVGSLNLTGAVQYATGPQSTFIESRFGVLFAGQPGAGQQQGTVNLYRLTANGGVFGTGAPAGGSSTVVSIFGINADQSYLSVGQGYVNGASLSGRSTFAGQTFASLA